MSKMKPLGSQVLLQLCTNRKSSILDLSQCQTFPRLGFVRNKGARVTDEIAIGDIVIFAPADLPILGDSAYLFIEENDIQAVVDPEILNELMDLGKEQT
jgi:hypothetical protein